MCCLIVPCWIKFIQVVGVDILTVSLIPLSKLVLNGITVQVHATSRDCAYLPCYCEGEITNPADPGQFNLFTHDPLSSLTSPMITHAPVVGSNLPIKSLAN